MAVVYSKVLLFDPPLIYTAPDICVFGAVIGPAAVRVVTLAQTKCSTNGTDVATGLYLR